MVGTCACTLASIPSHTYGPLLHYERDERHKQLDLFGPIFGGTEKPGEQFWEGALRPLFYIQGDQGHDSEEFDFLYPLVTYDRFGDDSRFQVFQLFAISTGGRQKGGVDKKFTLFPFVFVNRAAQAEKGYWAFFPLYGEIKHRLTFDRIYFIVFPVFSDFKKKDLRTRFVLFPIISWSEGKDIEGWKVFPFFGYQTKKGAYDKRYILFPFWISADLFWDAETERHARASLPFFYHEWSPTRNAWSVLWPFFRRLEDRKREYVEWDFPWPLWVIARGKDYNVTRFVPIYGQSQDRDRRGYLFLYPLWKWNVASQPGGTVETSRFLIYVLADTEKTRDGQSSRRVDSLPLFQYKRDYNGSVQFQTLAILEPVLPGNKNIIRNYSPLWTIFAHKRAPNGDASNVFLWNLYRWEKQGDKRQTSLLLGLVQFGSDGEKRSLRLFYLPRFEWK